MQNILNKIFIGSLILSSFFGILGCERDDICAADTPTTPLMSIEFYNNSNRTQQKNVPDFQVRLLGTDNVLFSSVQNSNAITIPLQTNASSTEYEFISSFGDATSENIDIVSIQYTPEDQYVSRACGFKTVFQGFTITVTNPDGDTDFWILDNERQQVNIENENEVHLFIYH